jgi:hypothetical protein
LTWIVAITQKQGNDHFNDVWTAHEDESEALAAFEEAASAETTWTASLAVVIRSTD